MPDGAQPDGGDPNQIQRLILGLDDPPVVRPLTEPEVVELNDPFAALLLRRGVFPTDVNSLLEALVAATPPMDPLRVQRSFVVGEGSQIQFSPETASLRRDLRLAIACGQDDVDVLVSTAATGDVASRFLQVMGWDESAGAFQYYERRFGLWIWAGSSFHSLNPPSRGEGPFDSHVNGGMVMKELKRPWNHWHSGVAPIPNEVLAPDDPARNDPLFENRRDAYEFETTVVRPGIVRWTNARFAAARTTDGLIDKVPTLLRQLFTTTTVNLASSETASATVVPGSKVALPATFFVDSDLLVGPLKLAAPPPFVVPGEVYLDTLQTFDVALVDGTFRRQGDTQFAFLVPERAFEDTQVVLECLSAGLLSARFIACALMVDFPNPVFSLRRAELSGLAPEAAKSSEDLEAHLVREIRKRSLDPSSAAAEFLRNWDLGASWTDVLSQRLAAYYQAIVERLQTADGFGQVFRLAESRRDQVRTADLSEKRPLLFAHTNLPRDPTLVMGPDGSVATTI
jgi:hypothetical protein